MRKPYILVIVFAVAILIICLVGRSLIAENNRVKNRERELREYTATLELVKDINQNSDFCGLELLKFSNKTGQSQQSGGSYDICPEGESAAEGGVAGYYFNYPKDSNDSRLTQISITVEPYHVYGIAVGQNINNIASVLEEKGFARSGNESLYEDTDMITYRQHHVSIIFDVYRETGMISTITVSVYDKVETGVY